MVVHRPANPVTAARHLCKTLAAVSNFALQERIRTWNDDILVMPHQILKNCEWSRLHIHVSPVYPAVSGPKRCAEQPIPGLGHGLTSSGLCSKAVSALHVLIDLLTKVLLHDGNFAIGRLRVLTGLKLS